PPVSIPDVTVFDYVFGAAGRLEGASRTAFIDAATGERLSFQQLHDRVLAAAGALAALGVTPGAVVALHAPNSPEFGVAFHAILRAGAAVTTIPVLATAADIARQIRASGAVALIADPAV